MGIVPGRRQAMGAAHRCRRAGRRLPARPHGSLWRAAAHPRRSPALGRRLRADGLWLGLPLVPTDAMCLILTFAALAGHAGIRVPRFSPRRRLRMLSSRRAVRELASLVASAIVGVESDRLLRLHDRARRCGLRAVRVRLRELCHAHRGAAADVLPTSRRRRRPARCSAAPALASAPSAPIRDEACGYSPCISAARVPAHRYVTAGGQPGMLSAWRDAGVQPASPMISSPIRLPPSKAPICATGDPASSPFSAAARPQAARAFKGEISAAELAAWLNQKLSESLRQALDGSHA